MIKKRLVIAGGGAAGFFGAITAAEHGFDGEIIILEKSSHLLSKVLVSGGGRCNVTHACFENNILIQNYPRGSKELRGPFSAFNTRDTIQWFEEKNIHLKTEEDGRVFPVTNRSETIAECLVQATKKNNIQVRTLHGIKRFDKKNCFELILSDDTTLSCDYLLLATGGHPKASGYDWITRSGHTIVAPVPSLFTFNIPSSPLKGLEGIALAAATIKIKNSSFSNTGPLLITHWGLSGPCILKLSAMAARWVFEKQYQFEISISFYPGKNEEEIKQDIMLRRMQHPGKKIFNDHLHGLPQRLWQRLAHLATIDENETWGQLKKEKLQHLVQLLSQFTLNVSGKTTYKEEFVTCGGIDLKEINFKTMESKLVPGLFFAGELVNIDGITGGFNFQNAWTTGWLAGTSIAKKAAVIS